MKKVTILKDQLPHFLDELIKEYAVFAPVRREGYTCFDRITARHEAVLELQNTKKPSKDVLLPKWEILFTFKTKDKRVTVEEPQIAHHQRVLIGVRPCEGRGYTILDKAYTLDEYKDVYYMQRRQNTTVIGMACDKFLSTCFCTSTGGSPFGREGLDLLFEDIGDRYLVDIITRKGEELIRKTPFFQEARNVDLERAAKIRKTTEDSISQIALEGVVDKLSKMFEDTLWDEVHNKCVSCGICAFFCPTCYCFDIVDEADGLTGRRMRVWDTCQFPIFTKQASGVNPRPSGKERMRQRIMHKFNYFPTMYGELACVGCGRCIRECPVNLDIRDVLRSIMER